MLTAGDQVFAMKVGSRKGIENGEIAALAPILTLCLLLGVFPQPIIESMKPDVQIVVNILARGGGSR